MTLMGRRISVTSWREEGLSRRASPRERMSMERLVTRLVLALLALVVLANAAFVAAVQITQDPVPRSLDGHRILAASRPAVVSLQAKYGEADSVPYPNETDPL